MSKPIAAISAAELAAVQAVFFDIDDTFSGGGGQHRITAQAYDALWKLSKAGIKVVPVTGRPAGWCDMITRMWPVTAVVGENGAFYSYLDHAKKPAKLVKKYLETPRVRASNALKLRKLHTAVLKAFPGAKTPSDQHYREFDLAIDYCEEVARWPDARVQKLMQFCEARGAIAKLSSIHVNTWFGRYDKLTCVRRILSQLFQIDFQNVVYIGDSPNDEPFFERLPFSVGVANVRGFLGKMKYAPAYITEAEAGFGFAEFAERLLRSRT
ncbi:MAG: HAD family phosphatase [Deltaproteobacteria bacterium]|nr:HAD family phosphatase [Deltaproteobacteria bacterium]